jgi:adenosylcobinamide-GDP ribazoletransferase
MFLRACVMAFSTYTAIPMPRFHYKNEDGRYVFIFFPLIGIVVAALFLMWQWIAFLWIGAILRGAVSTAIPLLITGGIHMDGFFDTVDARSSHKAREEKLRILDDAHVGAFAVIRGVIYLIVMFALMVEASFRITLPLASGFILSRCLVVYAMLLIPNAKGSGMLYEWQHRMHRPFVLFSALIFTLLALALAIWSAWMPSLIALTVVIIVFLNFWRIARREFGGITGDLAGYLIQRAELSWMFTLVVASQLI